MSERAVFFVRLAGITLLLACVIYGLLFWYSSENQGKLEAAAEARVAAADGGIAVGYVEPLVHSPGGAGASVPAAEQNVVSPRLAPTALSPVAADGSAPGSTSTSLKDLSSGISVETEALLAEARQLSARAKARVEVARAREALTRAERSAVAPRVSFGTAGARALAVPRRVLTSCRGGMLFKDWWTDIRPRPLSDKLVYVGQPPRGYGVEDLVRVKSGEYHLMVIVGRNKPSIPLDDEPSSVVVFPDGSHGLVFLIPPGEVAWVVPPPSGGWEQRRLLGFSGNDVRGYVPVCYSAGSGAAIRDARGRTWQLHASGCNDVTAATAWLKRLVTLPG